MHDRHATRTRSRHTRSIIALLLAGQSSFWATPSGAQDPPFAERSRVGGTSRTVATPPGGADQDWLTSVSAAIREREYHLSLTSAQDGFTAPNRAHDLRAAWRDGALEVTPRTDSSAWRFAYALLGIGRLGSPLSADSPVRREAIADGRIEWSRDTVREWYRNDARGIEQGFAIDAPPAGDRTSPIVIDARIEGLLAHPPGDGQSLLLRTPAGHDALRLSALLVRDASDRALPACLDAATSTLRIVIDDRGVVYPLYVDLLLANPAWTAESDQMDADFATSVATAGDVNGDGFADVLVGSPDYDNGESDEGRAFVYHGSASGLLTVAAWTAESNELRSHFGVSVATAGDVNGDGFSDVIVGADRFGSGPFDDGAAFVYHGSASGLQGSHSWTAASGQAVAYFGGSVATAGDVNGDGFSDVIVGAVGYDNGEDGEGRAYVYHGSASGLQVTPAWTAESNQLDARFGGSVATAGDVDGDGFSDVVVSAYHYDNGETNEGRAFVYHGSASGLQPTPAWTAESDQANALFAVAVATTGDVNGDGFADVIVGAWGYTNGENSEGRAFVYHGSASGLGISPAWTAEGDQADAYFGGAVATAGDVNGDGFADVIIGADLYDLGEVDEGRAFVYLGSTSGLQRSPLWTAEGDQVDASLGYSAATAGDVNGDGFSDVIVGAWHYDNSEIDEGRAFAYHGSASGLQAAPAWTAEGDQARATFGVAVGTAGDVNGDGFSDVIVGALGYDNGESAEGRAFLYPGSASGLQPFPAWTAEGDQTDAYFGESVATAGDVNGDGFSDVIVGALGYDNGHTDEGRALLYYGSAAGLELTAAWTAESHRVDARFGDSVATAGDVNGDGFSDVIVGATFDDRALVYHGSASGLSVVPAWSAQSGQPGAAFGHSVATAGDVNRDGFSDVIVGAFLYGNVEIQEGRAFVYHGSASGLQSTPAWTAESNQGPAASQGAVFGGSVGGAGDVNGDGFSDVIVGAFLYDNGEADEGRAYIYQGSASGLAAAPAWTAEGDQVDARFGYSVAPAGDVNGDGFSDVIVGASWYTNGELREGRTLVYHGSASGLSASSAWTAESDRTGAELGPVATAGDVNGDGFSDVIVGAPYFDNGETNEGRAFLYYGNDGDGLDRLPRQARADGSAPIDLLGLADDAGAFRLRANGRTPFGRDLVRLEWEVERLDAAFDGAGIETSAWFDTGAPGASGSVISFDETPTPLPAIGPYHWRLRLRSRFPFPWHSHWMGMPYNSLTETDLRAPCITPTSPGDLGNVLRAVARRGSGMVELTWSSIDPAIVAFHLRRGTTKAASYPLHPIAGILPAPGYSDAVLGDPTSYYYKTSGLNCAQIEGP